MLGLEFGKDASKKAIIMCACDILKSTRAVFCCHLAVCMRKPCQAHHELGQIQLLGLKMEKIIIPISFIVRMISFAFTMMTIVSFNRCFPIKPGFSDSAV